MTDTPSLPETGFAYDPVNQVIGGGIKNGVFHAFDPLNEIWIAETMLLEANIDPAIVAPDISLQTQSYHALDYHLEKNVYLFISDRRTWAYRYKKLNPNAPPKAPLVFINASPSQVALGASVSLEWNGIYAVGCESSGGAWLGSRGTNGSESVTPASLPMTYTLTCTGKGGDRVSQTTTVTLPGPVASDGGTSGGGGASSGSSGGASSSGIASDNLSSSGSGALWWDLLVILGVAVGIGVYRNR